MSGAGSGQGGALLACSSDETRIARVFARTDARKVMIDSVLIISLMNLFLIFTSMAMPLLQFDFDKYEFQIVSKTYIF